MAFVGSLIPWVQQTFVDEDGAPLAGGNVTFKEAGTNTDKDTYSEADLSAPALNTNPVVLDADGRPEDGAIFLEPGAYDIFVRDSANALVYTVEGVEDVGATFLSEIGQTLATGQKNAADNYVITDDDNLVTALPVAGGAYFLPSAADRGLPITFINLSTTIAAALTPDGVETINGAAGALPIPAGTSPVFSGATLVPLSPSAWYLTAYWPITHSLHPS